MVRSTKPAPAGCGALANPPADARRAREGVGSAGLPLTRRTVLGGLLSAPLLAQAGGGALYAYVGGYTTALRSARGDGIHVYRIDAGTGAWTHVQHLGDLVNPSFLVMAADRRYLYSVHGDENYASA